MGNSLDGKGLATSMTPLTKQVENTAAVLAFFDQLKGSVTIYKDNWATYSESTRPGYKFPKYFR